MFKKIISKSKKIKMLSANNSKITVLQVATLNRPIRSDISYGPIETVIFNIDKGLHTLGHHSIVACSGDSIINGEKYVTIDKSFKEYCSENTIEQQKNMQQHMLKSLARAKKGDIDIIHLHDATMLKYIYKNSLKSPVPIVMTLHVPAKDYLSFKKWGKNLKPSGEVYFVPISEYQKQEHPWLGNVMNVVHHGIDLDNFQYKKVPCNDSYLFTIARITRVKGQKTAIEVAKKTGSKLIIAGNVQNKLKDKIFFKKLKDSIDLCVDAGKHPADNDYYDKVMKPILDSNKQIIYIGEINREQKKLWYLHALATLFPIQWGEPFGLVMIESMSCGTPIIAFNKGSVPEIVIDGKTGFVVNSLEHMVEKVQQVSGLDPLACRKHIQDNFSIKNMAQKYLKLYKHILEQSVTMDYHGQRLVERASFDKGEINA